ncbi:3-keto-5-aminohexanoate cleavage protein [Inquilinus limosus]|uniref:3-keto-5-aminohexanoate cleavage protein n=1 Tax=Inquilinus limosus TaxID=171674 RepID=UPI003F18A987
MMERRPVAIAVAPNGGRRTKADHPALPITPAELARNAAECRDAGAAMIHIHVRDRGGAHLLDADAYRAAIAAIRAEVGDALVLQITSESLGRYRPAEQMAVVRSVRPEAVSLALRELVPDPADEGAFAEFLMWLKRERVAPQIILYAPEEAARLDGMRRRGLVPWDDIPVLHVLGRYVAGQTSLPADLLPFLASAILESVAPRFSSWMVCAFGRHEAACALAAALLGGDIRVGFENNLHRPDGSLAGSNADLVRAVAEPLIGSGGSLAGAVDLRVAWSK